MRLAVLLARGRKANVAVTSFHVEARLSGLPLNEIAP